jgi:hypothetical protein
MSSARGLPSALHALRSAGGVVAAPGAEGCLPRLRELLERSGAELTSVSETALTFRSPLSPSLDSRFPSRDEFGPSPVEESSVVVTSPGTIDAAIRFEISIADACDLALFWSLFLLPLFVVSPILLVASGSPVAWLGIVAGVAGNAANWLSFRSLRARTEAAFRRLVLVALEAGEEPAALPVNGAGGSSDRSSWRR